VVSVTDPYGRILGFLDRSRYFSIKCTHEAEWTPFQTHYFFFCSAGNRTRASGSVAKNSDHLTTEAVEILYTLMKAYETSMTSLVTQGDETEYPSYSCFRWVSSALSERPASSTDNNFTRYSRTLNTMLHHIRICPQHHRVESREPLRRCVCVCVCLSFVSVLTVNYSAVTRLTCVAPSGEGRE
jgi:hypothetical protein